MPIKTLDVTFNADLIFIESLQNLCKEEQKRIAWDLYKDAGTTMEEMFQKERLSSYSDYHDFLILLEEAQEKLDS